MLRTGRKFLAAATLAGDILKGTVAVVPIGFVFGHDAALYAALGAFLGHLFPVWLGFKGGKGVATYIGLLLGLALWLLIAFCLIWIAIAAVSRLSLAALIATAATPGGAVVERQSAGSEIVSALIRADLVDAPR